MTITNGYTDLTTIKDYLAITVSTYDTQLSNAVNAASRAVDGYCGQRFWLDAGTVTRYYRPINGVTCETDPISTTTGLTVAVDLTGYGNYDIPLTYNTDYVLEPQNALLDYPARPYREITLVLGTRAYFPPSNNTRRPAVKVTATFGWPAIPDDVVQATLIKASRLFHRKDSPQGVVGMGADFGPVRISTREDPDVVGLLGDYRLAPVG
jgi:hypothetical protein